MESPGRSVGSDEENSSFELPEAELEELKPGIDYGEDREAGQAAAEGDQDRRAPSDRKDIPQAPLAERISRE